MTDCWTRQLRILEARKADVAVGVAIPKQRVVVDPVNHHLCLSNYCPSDTHFFFKKSDLKAPIPVAPRSQAWVCGLSLAGVADSIPAGVMDVCLLWILCIVRWKRSLWRADPSSRGVPPILVCVILCDEVQQWPVILQCVGGRGQTEKERKTDRQT
jgi:hypothetical protein